MVVSRFGAGLAGFGFGSRDELGLPSCGIRRIVVGIKKVVSTKREGTNGWRAKVVVDVGRVAWWV